MSTNLFTDDLFEKYQHWHGIATFLRCPHEPNFKDTDIGLIGYPYGGGNPVEHMQYLGPRTIRNRSMAYSRLHREFRIDPFKLARIRDLGDVPQLHPLVPDLNAKDAQAYYEKVFKAGIIPVSIGGDHSITLPILRAAASSGAYDSVGMIHFDCHVDSGPEQGGTKNHAGPFQIATDEGLLDPRRTVQIGMRGALALLEQDDWSKENFAAVITTESFLERGEASIIKQVREIVGDKPTYLTFDLDVLDPSEAPGVADPEMNGLRLREIMKVIHGLRGLNLMGADIVCYCPPLDNPSQVTGITGAFLLYEFVTLIADRHFGKS